MGDTYSIAEAQSKLPKLCRSTKPFVIVHMEKPIYVVMPIDDFDALLETMELLSNPKAMKTLRAAKTGKLAYRELNLKDINLGL